MERSPDGREEPSDDVDRDPVDAPALPARHDGLREDVVGGTHRIQHDVRPDAMSQQRIDGAIYAVLDPGAEHDRVANPRRHMAKGASAFRSLIRSEVAAAVDIRRAVAFEAGGSLRIRPPHP